MAQTLTDHFAEVSSERPDFIPPDEQREIKNFRNAKPEHFPPCTENPILEGDHCVDSLFRMCELKSILGRLGLSATGPDKAHNWMLKIHQIAY